MRHRKKNNHLGRKTAHRSAMLSNMATSLIMHKRIFTTVPKAKELRKYVEPLITQSKEDSTTSRRNVFSKLQNKYAVTELFQTVSQKVGDRPGGYTRIIKTGNRLGDNASMCFIELVDFNENMLSDGTAKKAKTRRSRRGKGTGVAAGAKAEDAVKSEESKEVKETKKAKAKTKETESKVEKKEPKKVKETETKEEVETKAEVENAEEVATTEKVDNKKTETESGKAKEEDKNEVKDDKKVEDNQTETPSEEKA
ncbi:MAG: 50S ribosomal protein L17 [Fermentimonas sp.]|jgi:large subunit ribosomal protein L17|nr:50S ribosomal protein L17 [Fermentimonas sp.]NLC86477.1 50S ribosomal protein L17 [Bacteroidales bacterium]HBT86419.1 50S ribosomal protein L17 [Porphyromonadaceae bacterium]MDD2931053.1 50S ribosomal protein L17 [Fermentimonas sp.]MDD3189126.1 50S ribosomal protein L17 [Fermentimonas sp.]